MVNAESESFCSSFIITALFLDFMQDWLGLLFFVFLIAGIYIGLKILSKPQNKTEAEFEWGAAKNSTMLGASFNALQEVLNPGEAKAKEAQMQVKERRYDKKKREGKANEQIIYREANIKDVPAIAEVHIKSWQKSFKGIVPPEFLSSMSLEKRIEAFEQGFAKKDFYKMLVAEIPENKIIGFADFGIARDKNLFDAELYAIYFLSEYQRKGIGGNLFRMCQREMLSNDVGSFYLKSLEISPYKKFYQKMGGRKIGEDRHSLAGIEHKTIIYGWKDLSEKYND